jgi:hypothetical protein
MNKIFTPSSITTQIVGDLVRRDEAGQAKYGTSMDRKDLSLADWLQHNYEELLDACQYNRAAFNAVRRMEEQTVALLKNTQRVIDAIDAGKLHDVRHISDELKTTLFSQQMIVAQNA